MHIADVLSRLAGRDLDPPDKVIPISFNAMQTTQQPRRSPRNRKPPMKIIQPTTKMNSKQIPHLTNHKLYLKEYQNLQRKTFLLHPRKIQVPRNYNHLLSPPL